MSLEQVAWRAQHSPQFESRSETGKRGGGGGGDGGGEILRLGALVGAEEEQYTAGGEQDVCEQRVRQLQVRVSGVARHDVSPAQQRVEDARRDEHLTPRCVASAPRSKPPRRLRCVQQATGVGARGEGRGHEVDSRHDERIDELRKGSVVCLSDRAHGGLGGAVGAGAGDRSARRPAVVVVNAMIEVDARLGYDAITHHRILTRREGG